MGRVDEEHWNYILSETSVRFQTSHLWEGRRYALAMLGWSMSSRR